MKLFVYGELCKLAVLRRVLGRVPAAAPAILLEHTKRHAEHGHFEAVPVAGARVAGLVLEVARSDLARLDRFEDVDGGMYRRAGVRVRILGSDGTELDASAYLAPELST